MKTSKMIIALSALLLTGTSCEKKEPLPQGKDQTRELTFTMENVARMMSELPLRKEHLDEVFNAVSESSGNGYDEEYTMSDLIGSPGSGVGQTKATKAPESPIRDLITSYLISEYGTKSGAADVERYLNELLNSDYQIYWPYSEDWDGVTYPIVTFDPGYGTETNYGYRISFDDRGARVVDSVIVDEEVARNSPVWVINTNDDSAYTPLEMIRREVSQTKAGVTAGAQRNLKIKDFTMLRNYDSWFGGASEFLIRCGHMADKKSYTEDDLKNFYPELTDLMVSIKRRDVGKAVKLDALLINDFSQYLDKIALLITEDDGGTRTSWKCSATIKIKSKTYGFDLSIPYYDKDDIVWRGTLSADYFRETSPVTGRFGDVKVTFDLE